ncbi:MAG: sugar nucleotide-binding protein [Bacteroidia bacterium]|nr:sugar nucleotide-binding protein [Bacteroidia bacterium]
MGLCTFKIIGGKNGFAASIRHGEGVCTWFDFATEIIKESGLNCRVDPVLSKDFPQTAKRPSYSVMDKTKIKENYNLEIPYWRTSMVKCLKLIK